jgi:hypothetical protein
MKAACLLLLIFYADWCSMQNGSLILESLALNTCKIMVYKVNTENEQNWLLFGIQSIP